MALVGGVQFGLAAEDQSGVSLVKHQNGYTITAPAYQASIGLDGNLHSFRIGEVEMLDDQVGISLGSFFYSTAPLRLPRVSSPERATVEASDGGRHLIRYKFGPTQITLTLVNRSLAPASYFVVLSPDITIVRNARTGEAAAAPANARWADASFYTRQGEFLTVRGGDRVWGPWLDRQVWEVAHLPADGSEGQIVLEGGKGPQPKAALEQLLGLHMAVMTPTGGARGGVELSAEVENRADEAVEGSLALELSACRSELVVMAAQPLELLPAPDRGGDGISRAGGVPGFLHGPHVHHREGARGGEWDDGGGISAGGDRAGDLAAGGLPGVLAAGGDGGARGGPGVGVALDARRAREPRRR